MRKAVVRFALDKAISAGRSDVVSQATAAAGEMLRVRRDPGVVAARRVRSAKRRMTLWTAGAALPAAGVATQILNHGAAAAFASAEVLRTVLFLVLLVVCLAGTVRAVGDYRRRRADQRALPPPAPARSTVAAAIRADIGRLNNYSDGLRALAAHTGVDPGSPLALELRRDILVSADAAELTLRRRAAEFGDLQRAAAAAPRESQEGLRAVAGQLAADIAAGVTEYGHFVTAVSEIVVAGRTLRPDSSELTERTDALRALAMGMREIAG